MKDWLFFAREAGLRYVHDCEPGFTRRRRGKGFRYYDHQNNLISSDRLLHRIGQLVIPPAWQNIWICRFDDGHLQVTGRDDRSRKQYRYHPTWSQLRNQNKFHNLELFGSRLPKIRSRLKKDLTHKTFSRECVLAAVVAVMEKTHIRIGNDIYAEQNKSYGLTTILNKHAQVHGSHIDFKFRGKSGVWREAEITDRRLSHIVRGCQELPGQELFAYIENGRVHDVGSQDVNDYLREISGSEITAKDFRTWAGTVTALETLSVLGPLESETKKARKAREVQVIKAASQALGNTPAVCKKYYVNPLVFEKDQAGDIPSIWKMAKRSRETGLSLSEKALMRILRSK